MPSSAAAGGESARAKKAASLRSAAKPRWPSWRFDLPPTFSFQLAVAINLPVAQVRIASQGLCLLLVTDQLDFTTVLSTIFSVMSIGSYILSGISSFVVVTLSLFALGQKVPRAAFAARCLAAYGSLLLCAVYGVIASIVLRLVGYGRVSQWATARSFKWVMRYTTGVKFEFVEGEEYLSTRPAVFLGNHQTELDVLMLGYIFPPYCSVTAKKSLRNIPFLGWFMALSRTVFIDRANRETALKAFDGAVVEMKTHRQSVFIFPEGTRSYSDEPTLLPFKKGAFHLAVKAGVPIVPIVVENYSHILSPRALRFNAGTIKIKGMFQANLWPWGMANWVNSPASD